jgi:hypothetical protein
MVEPLADIQSGLCLYCRTRVDVGEVDHFVPWSRYPRDLAHNLVLAHRQCNRQKSDLLAAEGHLDLWMRRNEKHADAIGEAGERAGIAVDLPATIHVAAWAYAHGVALQTAAWVARDAVERLTDRWKLLLVEA